MAEQECLTRTCSFDSSFEQILLPDKWPEVSGDIEESKLDHPLTREQFEKFLDPDGRIVDETGFRKAVFKGGIEGSVRKDAWKFLFGYYPFQSTRREREVISLESRCRYKALKARWKSMTPDLCPQSPVLTHSSPMQQRVADNQTPSDKNANKPIENNNGNEECTESSNTTAAEQLSEQVKQQMVFLECEAKIYAQRYPLDPESEDLKKSLRIIDKDVPRTDRDLPFFKGATNPNLKRLRDILITFAVFHPKVTYAQGMNDVLSRFLVVMEDEVDAYWCFTLFMDSIFNDFLEDGMIKKLCLVQQLMEEIDPILLKHLEDCDVGDLMFLHRWLLLCFKREFAFQESLTIFEIVCSQHLELSSAEAERIRDEVRAQDFQRAGGGQRNAVEVLNTEFTFELFVCAAILHDYREKLLECQDSAGVFQFVMNGLTNQLDLNKVLWQAEQLLLAYCRKKVVSDSFELVDVSPTAPAPPRFLRLFGEKFPPLPRLLTTHETESSSSESQGKTSGGSTKTGQQPNSNNLLDGVERLWHNSSEMDS